VYYTIERFVVFNVDLSEFLFLFISICIVIVFHSNSNYPWMSGIECLFYLFFASNLSDFIFVVEIPAT